MSLPCELRARNNFKILRLRNDDGIDENHFDNYEQTFLHSYSVKFTSSIAFRARIIVVYWMEKVVQQIHKMYVSSEMDETFFVSNKNAKIDRVVRRVEQYYKTSIVPRVRS